ncbi:MAG: DUF2089 domain-containing protein [Caldilineaceae bacterium]
MSKLPKQCPICQADDLTVTGFYCRNCDSRVEGRFVAESPFAGLSPEQMHFALTFVRCEGKLTRMEEELGISYPTIRGRLHEVIRALGYEPGKDESAAVSEKDRRKILEALEAGELSYAEAMRRLEGEAT